MRWDFFESFKIYFISLSFQKKKKNLMISLFLDSFLRNFDPLLFELDSSQKCLQLSLVSGNGPPFLLNVSIRNLSKQKKKSDFLFLESNLRSWVSFFSGLALAEMLSLYSKRWNIICSL